MATSRPGPTGDDLLTKREVARLVRLGIRTITRYVALGKFPQPIRFSRTCVRWRRKDIDDYLERLSGRGRSTASAS